VNTQWPGEYALINADTRHYILGTAGHIDHGKSSLVKALTGVDPDRLPEERRRGMTIELGFAELAIGSARFGIVDVPGHERFVRTMVAGASGIDVAMLVVAADDSVMPQTIEHVEILKLLGVRRGVVALTKTDLVDNDMVGFVREEIVALLAGSALERAEIVPVSAMTGHGLDELKQAILRAAQRAPLSPTDGPFRMAVDRVFAVQGRGTVVTGSALRGSIGVGDSLEAWPAGESCRVRDLQTYGTHRDRLHRGQRCAINLIGIDREKLERGAELATPHYLQPSRLIDVRLTCLASAHRPLKSTGVVRLEIGTAETLARVVLLDRKNLEPGASAYAQLRSSTPITSTYGQCFILRDENATRTIGGGVVLRPSARRRHRNPDIEVLGLQRLETGDAADRVEEVLRQAGFNQPADLRLAALAGVEPAEVPDILAELKRSKRWVPLPETDMHVVPAVIDELAHRLTGWLERHHVKNPDRPGRIADAVTGWLERMAGKTAARPLFDELLRRRVFKRLGQYVCLPAFAPKLSAADEKLLDAMIREIRDERFQPPTLDDLSIAASQNQSGNQNRDRHGAGTKADQKRLEKLATLAVALGDLVHIEGKIYLHTETEQLLREIVQKLIRDSGGVTVSQAREALDSSRKYTVPFLEYLDRIGCTRRQGDVRYLADDA
jgi:selenocysteine-specific elongation factor